MPSYMVQLSRDEHSDLGKEFTFFHADSHQDAMEKALTQLFKVKMTPDLFEDLFKRPLWARVALNSDKNKHENGMPICVHAFKLEIEV